MINKGLCLTIADETESFGWSPQWIQFIEGAVVLRGALRRYHVSTRDEADMRNFWKSLHLTHMEPKRVTELLTRTAVQLVSGKELIREKKKMMKKAKDPLVVSNTKHEIETVSTAVEGIKQHRRLLKQGLAKSRAAS